MSIATSSPTFFDAEPSQVPHVDSVSYEEETSGGNDGGLHKLFFRINEVAKMTGLKPYVLRYWEGEFPELSPSKDASDQRRYRKSDIEVVLAIRKLLYEDRFTIEGARKRLRMELKRRRGETATVAKPAAAVVSVRPTASASPVAMTRPRPAAPSPQLKRTLNVLRSEVKDLLALLGA